MTFSSKLKAYFAAEIRQRGAEYFRLSRISYRTVGVFAAHGQVKGNLNYHCSFLVDQGPSSARVSLSMECDCPYFQNGDTCKHLWAFALALDGDPWTDAVVKARMLDVEEVYPIDEDEEEHEDEEEEETDSSSKPRPSLPAKIAKSKAPMSVPWEQFKNRLLPTGNISRLDTSGLDQELRKTRALSFVLDTGLVLEGGDLALRFYYRDHLKDGKLGVAKPISLNRELKRDFIGLDDRELFKLLLRECDGFKDGYNSSYYKSRGVVFANNRESMAGILLQAGKALPILTQIAEQGKLFRLDAEARISTPSPLLVSEHCWQFEVKMVDYDALNYRLAAIMVERDKIRDVDGFNFFGDGRFAIENGVFHPASLFVKKHQDWLTQLTLEIPVIVPKKDFDTFVIEYSRFPYAPPMRWPDGFQWTEETLTPRPKLRLSPYYFAGRESLSAEILFQYPDEDVNALNVIPSWVNQTTKRITLRDFSAEAAFIHRIQAMKAVHPVIDPDLREEGKTHFIYPNELTRIVDELEESGWDIDVQGKKVRVLRDFEIVADGETDWFDLSVKTKIDAKSYSIPQLLKNHPEGDIFIPLGKNEVALLPEEWRERFELLKKSGTIDDDRFHYPSQQALMLDSLLSELKIENQSGHLESIRQKIRDFKALEAVEAPKTFKGTLRDYQKEGLAWLEFLQDFGFGGCLSDEMGLGKTIQVLAMLLRYHSDPKKAPSLIVVPRSLVTNWISEAAKFCPSLRVMDLSGASRDWQPPPKNAPHLLITTYGILRQDIKILSLKQFGYVVLDESQTIKNSSSQAAKASLVLKSHHRLAMSGTPIENHMRELMSLMNFLNPGLLNSPHWKEVFKKKFDAADPFVKNLTTAIRPLMLRRSKNQVLKDLPPKIEDVLYCDLEGEQRQHYDELRLHYQMNLLPGLQDETWKKSSIVVIEALLRLRQAACHSGLVDKKFAQIPSAKLETLFGKLQEIRESGHKALIFSQFTSFLKIVSEQMENEGTPFEYLDGSTRDRAARIERFQNDPKVPFFLISLKAGGVGLNLTAADYCFILDPWWNPAAEAQAIDRAHRINQKNTVFAYRLIARNTVEEKIQELQKNKRMMVESILAGEGSLLNELDLKSIQSLFLA